MSWALWADRENAEIRAAGRWRTPLDFDASGTQGRIGGDGPLVVSFASNDYLGLTQHPVVRAAAHAALDRWGTGAGSARLIVGSRPVHTELEEMLAEWKASPRAALFASGFAANLGVLTSVAGPGTLVLSDELNHASIIDACRLSRADVSVYRHADVEHLRHELAGANRKRAVVVTDTVFSMDGDVAPLPDLAAVCRETGALLVLDEAHAVLGPQTDDLDVELLRIGTLSKMLGSLGGFVAGPASLIDLIVNRARPYIFTTASTPADTAAALAALTVFRSTEGAERRARLRCHVERVQSGHPSPIVPIVLGSEGRTLEAAAELLTRGMLVPAIRPPTVPSGQSRLRVTLSAAHTDAQVDALVDALATL